MLGGPFKSPIILLRRASAVRLFSLLKTALNGHGRICLLIQGFSKGWILLQSHFFGNSMSFVGDGHGLLRQLLKEFSLRPRSK